jgi:hypothetical protein
MESTAQMLLPFSSEVVKLALKTGNKIKKKTVIITD